MACDPSTFPEMDALQSVAKHVGVTLTVGGSAVRRWASLTSSNKTKSPSLFDVAPFVSDIDISHSGPPERTAALQRLIWQTIPFSEYFRWQIHDREQATLFANAALTSSIIPANLIEIRAGTLTDKWRGLDDIAAGRYRFVRNGFYRRSPLFRRGQDLELFGALLYFRLLLDSGVAFREITTQPGSEDALAIVRDTIENEEARTLLRERGHLRMRLRYLWSALLAAAPGGESSAVFELLRLPPLSEFLANFLAPREWKGGSALAISAYLQGDVHRLAQTTPAWSFGATAKDQFDTILKDIHRPVSALWKEPRLGEGQQILAASPVERIHSGNSQSENHVAPDNRPTTCEFLHFAVPAPARWPFDSGGMAVIGFFTTRDTGTLPFFPPSHVSFRPNVDSRGGDFLLRINCGMLFRNVAAEQSPSTRFLWWGGFKCCAWSHYRIWLQSVLT